VRQVEVMAASDMEVTMKSLLTGSLILMAALALLATGCERVAQAPDEQRPDNGYPGSYRVDVAEVVVTAERPGWMMPEVVARAGQMPEVVVNAAWSAAPVAVSALPPALPVN
jgi:hypothetical protein